MATQAAIKVGNRVLFHGNSSTPGGFGKITSIEDGAYTILLDEGAKSTTTKKETQFTRLTAAKELFLIEWKEALDAQQMVTDLKLVVNEAGSSHTVKGKGKGKTPKAATDLSEDWEKALQESHAAEVAKKTAPKKARVKKEAAPKAPPAPVIFKKDIDAVVAEIVILAEPKRKAIGRKQALRMLQQCGVKLADAELLLPVPEKEA